MSNIPMEGLAEYLRLHAEFGCDGDEMIANMNRWAAEVEAARARALTEQKDAK